MVKGIRFNFVFIIQYETRNARSHQRHEMHSSICGPTLGSEDALGSSPGSGAGLEYSPESKP